MRKRNEEFSLKELVNIFMPRLWLIMIVALICGSVMAVYSAVLKEDTYTSTTRIHVTKEQGYGYNYAVSDVDFATSYLETYKMVLTIPDFLNTVLAHLSDNHEAYEQYDGEYEDRGWDKLGPDRIKGYISCDTQQDILTVSVTTEDPILARALADSIAYVFTQEDILAYPDDVVKVKILQIAKAPAAPNSRNVLLNTAIGVIIGAVITMTFVFVMNMFDVIIHDKKKIEDTFDIPILGVIPRFLTEEGKTKT
jgi:capsular polysaccharide biosynthesis protein